MQISNNRGRTAATEFRSNKPFSSQLAMAVRESTEMDQKRSSASGTSRRLINLMKTHKLFNVKNAVQVRQARRDSQRLSLRTSKEAPHFTQVFFFIQMRRSDGNDSRVNLNLKPALPSPRLRVIPSLRFGPARP